MDLFTNSALLRLHRCPNGLFLYLSVFCGTFETGKAHKKYEFGYKVSLVTTHKEGFVLSSQALHETPYVNNNRILTHFFKNLDSFPPFLIMDVGVKNIY